MRGQPTVPGLLILDWDPHYRSYVLESCLVLGIEAHLVMREAPAALPSGAERVHVLPGLYDDPLQWVGELAEYVRLHGLSGVFTHEDELVELSAALSEELGFPGASLPAVRLCMDKSATRDRFAAAAVPGPRYRVASSLEEARQALDELTLPVVLKPVAASGGQGVTRLTDASALPQAWDWAVEPYGYLPAVYHRVIIEEFLEGPLVSVEAAVVDGEVHVITATDGLQTIEPVGPTQSRFVYDALLVPTRLPAEDYEAMAHWTREAVRALGIRTGIVHTEFKRTPHGVRIVEVNPRLPGVYIPELVHRALGIDLAGAALQLALGRNPDLTEKHHGAACARLLLARTSGQVHAVEGADEAAAAPHVVRACLFVAPGDVVAPPHEGNIEVRLGYVLTEHTDPHGALRAADEALAQMTVRTEGPETVQAAP
ncbi:ATP-grasp domain-containing protein [Streptomyces sp. C11-1]|uniref:ATP-grasp domain-containing protein n=1 Tax=Streptomyces durocortorensis TaxID=2811104 RepID=A0ABY9W5J4_9ACTN|nr:ATP-grasp domain-containing protein [Streptomyces durocortorensis]WNF31043.1 ATP-grasp domain-containing protein [Streptomyces durocortorensis]